MIRWVDLWIYGQVVAECGFIRVVSSENPVQVISFDLNMRMLVAGPPLTIVPPLPPVQVISFDPNTRLLVAGPGLTIIRALDYLEERGWTLLFGRLPFYNNLTFGGMLLTGETRWQ